MNAMFDLIVIGAGSGGVRAARIAAASGVKVAIVESGAFGGTCVNVGCVPKKLLSYAAHFSADFKEAEGFGWQITHSHHDWLTLIQHKNQEILRLNSIYIHLLEKAGVTIIQGRAEFVNASTLLVTNEYNEVQQLQAAKILIAVGGVPNVPSTVNPAHIITSDQVFYLSERPQRIVIVGGGYIAVEFASIFKGLGSEVHLIYRGEHVLKAFDRGIADFAIQEIQKKGIQIYTNADIHSITPEADVYHCKLNNGDTIVVDKVMYATGRKPATEALQLHHTSVKLRDNGSIPVADNFQTAEPTIFALGDVIGTPELTPVAIEQAMVFVDQQYGHQQKVMSYDAIPTTVFCHPNIATVGLSEQEVVLRGLQAEVFISEFRPLKHTLSGSSERMMLKMLVERSSQKLLGVHIVGSDAGEILQGFAVAVKIGLTKTQIDATIGIHPTAAEELVTMRSSTYLIG